MKHLLLLASILICSQTAIANPDHDHAPKIPKALENMKQLLGTWEGKTKMGDKEHDMIVTYALTSGGTAITETLMAGTPQEMVSVYHKDGDSVAMTHYCALGNQPHMKLKTSDAKAMAFEMAKPAAGIASAKEPHMHAVTLTLHGENTLKHDWVHYVDGKAKDTVTFNFKRKE